MTGNRVQTEKYCRAVAIASDKSIGRNTGAIEEPRKDAPRTFVNTGMPAAKDGTAPTPGN